MPNMTRKFNSMKYELYITMGTKALADTRAKTMRKLGTKARVVPYKEKNKKRYAVYFR